jgi:hypothetical protein
MESVFDDLLAQLTGEEGARALAASLGTDDARAAQAARAGLPALFGALARNAEQPAGSEALLAALDRDHDGSVLDDLGGFLAGGGGGGSAEAILGHVLGGRRGALEQTLGESTGLDPAAVGRLLAALAPLVMGALGRAQREQRLGAQELGYELDRARQRAETSLGDAFGPLGAILDGDGDGRVDPALAKLGTSLFKRIFRR